MLPFGFPATPVIELYNTDVVLPLWAKVTLTIIIGGCLLAFVVPAVVFSVQWLIRKIRA